MVFIDDLLKGAGSLADRAAKSNVGRRHETSLTRTSRPLQGLQLLTSIVLDIKNLIHSRQYPELESRNRQIGIGVSVKFPCRRSENRVRHQWIMLLGRSQYPYYSILALAGCPSTLEPVRYV